MATVLAEYFHQTTMRASEFITEKKKNKRRVKAAAWGPGPFGGYGYAAGYSGDGGAVGESRTDEKWQDWVMGAGIGAAALGGGGAAWDAYQAKQAAKEPTPVVQQQQQGEIKKSQPKNIVRDLPK